MRGDLPTLTQPPQPSPSTMPASTQPCCCPRSPQPNPRDPNAHNRYTEGCGSTASPISGSLQTLLGPAPFFFVPAPSLLPWYLSERHVHLCATGIQSGNSHCECFCSRLQDVPDLSRAIQPPFLTFPPQIPPHGMNSTPTYTLQHSLPSCSPLQPSQPTCAPSQRNTDTPNSTRTLTLVPVPVMVPGLTHCSLCPP